jgi:hypothetical protein
MWDPVRVCDQIRTGNSKTSKCAHPGSNWGVKSQGALKASSNWESKTTKRGDPFKLGTKKHQNEEKRHMTAIILVINNTPQKTYRILPNTQIPEIDYIP